MLPSLTSLELAACKLPTIPDHLSQVNLTSLASLDLGGNLLNSIPLWLFNLTGLVQLNLGVNSIHGPIHDAFDQMTSLVYLDLYDNNINTSIPKSLCNMSNLAYLNLGYNHLEGSIPSEIGHLAQLTKLILSGNNLKGSVPSSLGKVKKLQILYISNNMLTGVLSELHFEKLKELKKLTIYNNDLALNFSSSWIPPFQLRYIDMAYMKIGPRFPTWLQNQRELEELNLRGTGISDTIPNWFRLNCCNITTLDLSFNSISGNPLLFRQINHGPPRGMLLNNNKFEGSFASFPPDILELDLSGNLLKGNVPIPDVDTTTTVAMQFLTLNDNRLTGTIPKELCKMNRLETLDLSNNQLSGRLPSCLGNWRNLRELNLAKNSLSGQIPGSLGDLENLVILHMDRNKFIGNLGLISQNLKSLQFLDLGENDLEDFIPAWIGEKLLDLEFLRLESNNFQGGISYKLCQLTKLQVLNLAGNHLTGSIPYCFNNFSMMLNDAPRGLIFTRSPTARTLSNFFKGRELEFTSNLVFLKSISLSNNKLVGEIPEEIMDLAGLQNLNLSKNHLSGRIPDRIGNLKHLESLDLSINQLFGGIPPSLSAINSLSYLNVSYNNLSGRIPPGNQLQTLTDPSIYQGNGGLCGKPLLKNCPGDNTPASFYDTGHHESDHFTWFYAGIGPGFAIGLVGVLSVLHFKKSWRYAYFKFVENAHSSCVMIALKASQLRRGISTD
ncbi:hypothetical protein ACH5RR_029814 [Cinchona calisaya]|uniref:Receptor-like protein EIX2 n=1 Tax=Cinchona calisaya TaxID=153742 RepID=A0ABD2YTZ3_9GENT